MATIFYADSAGAQGTGTGVSAANAATLINCITDNVILHTALVADSIIYCKNGTEITYDGSGGVFVATAVAGTATGPIRVIGYNSTITDGGVVLVKDTNAGANNDCFDIDHPYWWFENFLVTDAKDAWDSTTGASNGVGCYWRNCAAINPAQMGFTTGSGSSAVPAMLENVYVISSGNDGIRSSTRASRLVNCVVIDSVNTNFNIGNANHGAHVRNCISHKCGGDGFRLTGPCLLTNCVSNRSGSDGYGFLTATISRMINCGATSNSAYGVEGAANAIVHAINCGLNPTNEANTSGKSNTVTLLEGGAVAGDPDFADSNPGTAANVDLSLSATSAWKAAAEQIGSDTYAVTNYQDIGPMQRQEPAGGGGGAPGNMQGGLQ